MLSTLTLYSMFILIKKQRLKSSIAKISASNVERDPSDSIT